MSFDISRFWLHALLAAVVGAGLAAPSVLRAEDADDAVEEDDVGDEEADEADEAAEEKEDATDEAAEEEDAEESAEVDEEDEEADDEDDEREADDEDDEAEDEDEADDDSESKDEEDEEDEGDDEDDEEKSDADDDSESKDEEDEDEDSEESEDADPKTKSAADPFAVPEDASNEDLAAFIKGLQTREPDVKSREEYIEHLTKAHTAIVAASDKILAAEPDAGAEGEALKCKLSSMFMLGRLELPGAAEGVKTLAEELKDDKREDVASEARLYLFASKMQTIDAKKPKEIKSLIADLNAELKKPTVDPRLAGLAPGIAQMIEQSGANELALEAYESFAASLEKNEDEQIAAAAEQLKASARKLGLIGNPLEIEGTLVGGETFNWADYKGKVVLVDFWATWCGPCVAELPNVKETYEKFHKRGFEVIGISLDDMDNREELETFLAAETIEWPIMFGTEQEASGWQHPMARKYAINAIPAAILINREGNVVTLDARGEELPKLVAELIGPEEEPAEEKPAKKTTPAKAKPAKPATKADDGEAAEEKPAAPKATPAKPAKKKPAPKE